MKNNTNMSKIKSIIKKTILRYVGYGSFYRLCQKSYQALKKPYYKHKYKLHSPIGKNIHNDLDIYKETCDMSEVKAFARRVASAISSDAGPLVSIVILNYDKDSKLSDTIKHIRANTMYKNYEILIFDNNKSSINRFMKNIEANDIKVIQVTINLNISELMNIGARNSEGKCIVFLENGCIPLYGWLDELMHSYMSHSNCCIVVPKLLFNNITVLNKDNRLQQQIFLTYNGKKLETGKNELIMYSTYGTLCLNSDDYVNEINKEVPFISEHYMLIDKMIFDSIGGFNEVLRNGKEILDFCLKINLINKKILINEKSLILVSRFFSCMQGSINQERLRLEYENYRELYKTVWSEKITLKDRIWTTGPLHIAFMVTEYSRFATAGDLFSAKGLGDELRDLYNYKISYFPRRPEYEWDKLPKSVDIMISMINDFDIRKSDISDRTFKIAWIRGHIDEWLSKPWIYNYDAIITSSKIAEDKASRILGENKCWGIIPLGIPSYFEPRQYSCKRNIDVSFIGNIYDVPRQVVSCFEPSEDIIFEFYGILQSDTNHPWKAYHKGTILHKDIPKVYNRSKIVIEDTAIFNKGTINLRVYEALACGALVIANDTPGLQDVFGDIIEIYKDKEDLMKKIRYYLNNESIREQKAEKGRELVFNSHTFKNRAETFKDILEKRILKIKGI